MKLNRKLTAAEVVDVAVVDAVEVVVEAAADEVVAEEKGGEADRVSRLWYLYEAEFPGNKHL